MQDLKTLSTKELREKFNLIFKYQAPLGYTKTFLIKEILIAQNCETFSKETQGLINKLIKNYKSNKTAKLEKLNQFKTTIGTKFIREYKGEKYEVVATKEGFEFQNKKYKTLSAIANEITGKHWNGKKFFGVN